MSFTKMFPYVKIVHSQMNFIDHLNRSHRLHRLLTNGTYIDQNDGGYSQRALLDYLWDI